MTNLDTRIAQFEKMAHDDPENDMAHFSLGNAYLQAGRFAEAANSLERCITLNPGMSKAYQLAGDAMLKAGWEDKAVLVLNKGFEIAAGRGDRMPMTAMADLLQSIGREPPKVKVDQAPAPAADGSFICRTTGRAGTKMDRPPFRGKLGQWIHENVSDETWKAWIGQGTKVINELRLDLSRERDSEVYDQHMLEFLGIDEALHTRIQSGEEAAATT